MSCFHMVSVMAWCLPEDGGPRLRGRKGYAHVQMQPAGRCAAHTCRTLLALTQHLHLHARRHQDGPSA